MNYLSLFSGIGGFDLAFRRAGWECAGMCEIDKQSQSVLRRQFPDVPIYDDVHQIGVNTHARNSVDLLVGGFPCQDVSIAGKRAGLAGKRSGLWSEFARIIAELAPQWVLIENVPGLLSSNGGRDFGVIIAYLVELGYGVAWRVLDAQYFGVPQRRRRVFIVGHLGTGRASEVLFERGGFERNLAPGGESGPQTSFALTARNQRHDPSGQTYVGALQSHSKAHGHAMTTQQAAVSGQLITFNWQSGGDVRLGFNERPALNSSQTPAVIGTREIAQSLTSNYAKQPDNSDTALGPTLAIGATGVRRLTPTECERLQGFPDGWTDGQSDSARYRQLGNAVAVPVAFWLVGRL
jgi:DNA (cytosine-5)-methyltransferase 1